MRNLSDSLMDSIRTNQDKPEKNEQQSGVVALILRVMLPVGLIALGWFGYSMLSVEPQETKSLPSQPRVIKTKIAELRVQDYPTIIRTQGIVRSHSEVSLNAQVSGRIIRISPEFEDGAFVAKGSVLVELDPVDFSTAVIVAEAQLARAKTTYAQEQTRSRQAKLNWEDLGYDEEPNDLVLRLPQLHEAKAIVDSAAAQLERAKRDLERTKVRVPFDGRVRQRTVGLGQSVGPGTPLGIVFATDFAEVRLPITGRDMPFLDLPENSKDAHIEVELRDALNRDNQTVWRGKIIRTEGTLDENSLELFAIARIVDPFGRKSGMPPLRIGQPVIGIVPGRVLENVIAVPRIAVRQLGHVYLVDKKELTLNARTISPIWSDEEHLIIRDPTIPDGSHLATSNLIYAPDGAKVEILPNAGPTTTANSTSQNITNGKEKS